MGPRPGEADTLSSPTSPEEAKHSGGIQGQLKVQIIKQVHSDSDAAEADAQARLMGDPQCKSFQGKEEQSLLLVSSRAVWKSFTYGSFLKGTMASPQLHYL